MNAGSLFAVNTGAVIGAWTRRGLTAALNPLLPALLVGTLVVTALGWATVVWMRA